MIGGKIVVLELARNLNIGGTSRAMQEFALNLDPTKFEVIVGAYDVSGPRRKILQDNHIEVVCVTNGTLNETIERKKIDIVHSHEIKVKPFIGDTKNIQTVVFFEGFSDDAEMNLIISKTLALKISFNKNLVYGKNYLPLYYPQNLVSWQKYLLTKEEIQQKRRALGIKPSDIVIGRLGRAELSKVDYLLLYSAPLIAEKYPNVKFVFCGLTQLYEFFLRQHKSLVGKMVFLPQTADDKKISEFYQIIDVFWHTASRGETFGNVIAEAMSFKKTVITHSTHIKRSFLSYNPLIKKAGTWDLDNAQIELVDHMKTGLIANYPHDVLAAVGYFVRDPKKIAEFGENAYEKTLNNFDAKLVLANFQKVAESVFYGQAVTIKPSESELLEYFETEYWARLTQTMNVEKINQIYLYKFKKLAFTISMQYPYLVFRLMLRKMFRKNIEK